MGCTIVICHFWIRIVKDKANCLLGLKIIPGRVSWPLGPTDKLFMARGKKNVAPPWLMKWKDVKIIRLGLI
jgi:hypothetical protein